MRQRDGWKCSRNGRASWLNSVLRFAQVWRYRIVNKDAGFSLPYLIHTFRRYGTLTQETQPVTAAQVRTAFPECVGFADEFREVFGPGVALNYASENGQSIGRQTPLSPETTLTLSQMVIEVPKEEPVKQGRRNGR